MSDDMSNLDTYQLTHPELMSETELRDILRNRCIDFNNSQHLSRSELIDMYKRIAMPLPQRQLGSNENFNMDVHSMDEFHRHSNSLRNTSSLNRPEREPPRTNQSCLKRTATTSWGDHKHVAKEIRLSNSMNGTECNGIPKRGNGGRHDESPTKKRQKITWP